MTSPTDDNTATPPASTDAVERFQTEDGSYSLVDRDRQLHYSSTHGAADEARHVFVEGTRVFQTDPPWQLLEFGFGGGVNFVQTVQTRNERDRDGDVVYHAVEHRPVSPDVVDFHQGTAGRLVQKALARVAGAPDETVSVQSEDASIQLHLHTRDWHGLDLPDVSADAVYFDPFGPGSQPDAWTTEAFQVANRHLAEHGRLTTYSAATDVKRAMFEAGLHVASAPGAGPKREMTVAAPTSDALSGLDLLDPADYRR